MTSKDKPKRGEGRTFVRETKPKAAAAKSETGAKSFRKDAAKGAPKRDSKAPAKAAGKRDLARAADEKLFRKQSTPSAAAATGGDQKPERISKILARAGVASRRDIERMILDGRVTLNGKLLDTPVINVTLDDKVEVDGVPIRGIERTRLWLYHKPGGLVTTNADPEGRPTSSTICRKACRAFSPSAASTSTPKACCCSPTMVACRAFSNCRPPAGCAATASAPMARSIRKRWTS